MSRATWGVAFASGVGFGFGLAYSTMTRPEVVLDFLRGRDWGLMLVLGGAVAVTLPAYRFLPKMLRKPLFASTFGKHHAIMSRHTIGGAALFGVGWGVGGVCPGAAFSGLGSGNWPLLIALAGMFLGAYVQGRVSGRTATPKRTSAAAVRAERS